METVWKVHSCNIRTVLEGQLVLNPVLDLALFLNPVLDMVFDELLFLGFNLGLIFFFFVVVSERVNLLLCFTMISHFNLAAKIGVLGS